MTRTSQATVRRATNRVPYLLYCGQPGAAPYSRAAPLTLNVGLGRSQPFAYTSALITSMPTNGSSPSTHASWPGGMVYDIPGRIVV